MIDKLTSTLDFNAKALTLRAERQRILASNIANVDTPGYVARDFKFSEALQEATQTQATPARQAAGQTYSSDPQHIALTAGIYSSEGPKLGYAVASQPSADANSVDLDRERAAFADNAIRYEATLRFINGNVKTMLSAIQGQ